MLLDSRIGGPGQYSGRHENPNTFYLPLAGDSCCVVLTFKNKKIVADTPGPAFDAAKWKSIDAEVENSILRGPTKVGREYTFSGFRVMGSWCGQRPVVLRSALACLGEAYFFESSFTFRVATIEWKTIHN